LNKINIVVSNTISENIENVFKYVVPIDLHIIFKKKGFIPGVISTSNKEKWYVPGMSRIVMFDDGSSVFEKLTGVLEFESFTYKINQFTSVLKYLIYEINGKWNFKNINNKKTEIYWEYSLSLHNIFCSIIVFLFVKRSLNFVLDNALNILKNNINDKKFYNSRQ
jgi:hypothetical protein